MAKKKAKKQEKPIRGINLTETLMAIPADTPVRLSPRFSITVNGLHIEGEGSPPFEEWAQIGDVLRTAERGVQFALGDFLLRGEQALNERFSQIVDHESGWSESTCRVYQWLAKQVPVSVRRMDKLSIAHHLLVAALNTRQQASWLNKAADDEDGPWTVSEMRRNMKDGGEDLEKCYWVVVAASSPTDQIALMDRLRLEGRSVKPTTSRKKKEE